MDEEHGISRNTSKEMDEEHRISWNVSKKMDEEHIISWKVNRCPHTLVEFGLLILNAWDEDEGYWDGDGASSLW